MRFLCICINFYCCCQRCIKVHMLMEKCSSSYAMTKVRWYTSANEASCDQDKISPVVWFACRGVSMYASHRLVIICFIQQSSLLAYLPLSAADRKHRHSGVHCITCTRITAAFLQRKKTEKNRPVVVFWLDHFSLSYDVN